MIWKQLTDYNYEVSDTGQIRHTKHKKILKQKIAKSGHKAICLFNIRMNKYRTEWIHRLVAVAFIGDTTGLVVDHINRDPADNQVKNLRIVTQYVNMTNKGHCPNCSCELK